MTSAVPDQRPRRRFWPMPMIVSWRRFGMSIIGASTLILLIGLVLYLMDSEQPPQTGMTQQAGTILEKAAGPLDDARAVEARATVEQFVAALEQRKIDVLRNLFPTMTAREARILLAIRARLGEDADLQADTERLAETGTHTIRADFVILASGKDARVRRLPFSATLADDGGAWRILTLR